MAGHSSPSRRSSTASRRTFQRQSTRLSQTESLIDIFADDNESDFMPVADGFRPSPAQAPGSISSSQSTISPPSRPSSPQLPPRAASPPIAKEYLKKRLPGQERHERQSSIQRSSVSNSQRDTIVNRVHISSGSMSRSSRPLSTVSGLSIPASESPYNVSAGPSNAFAPYPQVSSLNRHASTSTVQTQNRPYNGPSRPTHPYAMYPQVPAQSEPEVDDPFADPADIANVGFPGLSQNYARVRGADGEDADDLIGPDGHTEQLPPYSQFPHDLPPKVRNEIAAETETAGPSRYTAAGVSAADQAADPRDSLSEPSAASSLLNDGDEARLNPAAANEENRNRLERLKDKSKRRWARIPVWGWAVFVFILCACFAGLGAALGKTLGHPSSKDAATATATLPPHDHGFPLDPGQTVWQTVTTTLIDAVPLATAPANFPDLPVGTYAVPLEKPIVDFNNCMTNNKAQNISWQCSGQAFLNISIQQQNGADCTITLQAEYHKDSPLLYGAQAPSMRGPASVSLVTDIQDPNKPAAWFFQQLQDKLVIIQDDAFMASGAIQQKGSKYLERATNQGVSWASTADDHDATLSDDEDDEEDYETYLGERDELALGVSYEQLAARDFGQEPRTPVLTGDTLWFCYWNSTVLEGFIYADKPISLDPGESSYLANAAASSLYTNQAFTAIATANPTASYVAKRDDQVPSATPTTEAQTTTVPAPQGPPNYTPMPLPYTFKLEERRGANMPSPYCIKMKATVDGTLRPVLDDNQNQIRINITEVQPISQNSLPSGSKKRRGWDRDQFFSRQQATNNDSNCRCIWQCA